MDNKITFFETEKSTGSQSVSGSPIEQAVSRYFIDKGLARLKEEDRSELFDQEWIQYQGKHQIFSELLDRKNFDPRKIARFMERIAFYSTSHAYSYQVSILGIVPFWRAQNQDFQNRVRDDLKKGAPFAFGLSEKNHGADLYSTETLISKDSGKNYLNGAKYYIGNANCAGWMSVLARDPSYKGTDPKEGLVFVGIQPKSKITDLKKIQTAGVRTSFVGGFTLKQVEFSDDQILSRGRQAWDAIFGTVNLGKFMLGFGSVGLCERALLETLTHIKNRKLYGKTVFDLPQVQTLLSESMARLWGMKTFGYRAIDYMYASDRRTLLFNSVQKARVTTEGVKVVGMLFECMGAKGVEADTAFESIYREIAMLPSLEGSTHINFGLIAKLAKNVFMGTDSKLSSARMNQNGHCETVFSLESGKLTSVRFHDFISKLDTRIQKQARFFRWFMLSLALKKEMTMDLVLGIGRITSIFVQAALVCERDEKDSVYYDYWIHLMIEDVQKEVLNIIATVSLPGPQEFLLRQMIIASSRPVFKLKQAVSEIIRF